MTRYDVRNSECWAGAEYNFTINEEREMKLQITKPTQIKPTQITKATNKIKQKRERNQERETEKRKKRKIGRKGQLKPKHSYITLILIT